MTMTLSGEEQKRALKKTIRLTMAQALILFLARQKVELFDGSFTSLFRGVFGIYGHGNVNGIGEALWEFLDDIPYFRGQSEQGMAHAAIAFAKASRCRRMMAVTSSVGPGATNMVTACALAHVNRLPVLFLPGDVYVSRRPDPVLQQLEDFSNPLVSVNDCFKPVSRYFDRITRPEQLMQSLPNAIETMLNPISRGPATISLPQDVQVEAYDFPLSFFEEKVHYIERARPDRFQVHVAAEVLRTAVHPLIIVGGGVHYSGAEAALKSFVEKHQIPIAETQAGKGCLSWDHPLNLGAIGVTGTSCANALAKHADVVICVGTRLGDFPTASKSLFHRENCHLIGINISPFDAMKGNAKMVVADVLEGLSDLSEALGDYRTHEHYWHTIHIAREEWEYQCQEATSSEGAQGTLPTDAQVLSVVNEVIDGRDVVVCAAGGLPGELHKLWKVSDISAYHLEYGFSCMGYEIAGGLGVKMAHPDREVYVMVGDGSYLMLHTELLTSIKLGFKINIILLDNKGFGCINRLQKSSGSVPYGNLFDREEAGQVDFVANAQSYGAHALKVESLEELEKAIEDNRSRSSSCVIVIETDPEQGTTGSAWWDVPIAERSAEAAVIKARKNYEKNCGCR
jgi:3D-(3,5/4)-trihydroxycyclohexane-1,2-dione acylhydrolase (decyclizing)